MLDDFRELLNSALKIAQLNPRLSKPLQNYNPLDSSGQGPLELLNGRLESAIVPVNDCEFMYELRQRFGKAVQCVIKKCPG